MFPDAVKLNPHGREVHTSEIVNCIAHNLVYSKDRVIGRANRPSKSVTTEVGTPSIDASSTDVASCGARSTNASSNDAASCGARSTSTPSSEATSCGARSTNEHSGDVASCSARSTNEPISNGASCGARSANAPSADVPISSATSSNDVLFSDEYDQNVSDDEYTTIIENP